MTNGERVRLYTDRELAEKFFVGKCPPPAIERCFNAATCVECWMAWLGQEVDERSEDE